MECNTNFLSTGFMNLNPLPISWSFPWPALNHGWNIDGKSWPYKITQSRADQSLAVICLMDTSYCIVCDGYVPNCNCLLKYGWFLQFCISGEKKWWYYLVPQLLVAKMDLLVEEKIMDLWTVNSNPFFTISASFQDG